MTVKKVVLISCVSKKLATAAAAQDLYTSTLFRLNLEYAKSIDPDAIFILSALYGLVTLHQIISPYDITLNNMKAADRKAWASQVIEQLERRLVIPDTHFIFLAGQRYRQYLIPHMPSYEIPLQGMRIGEQLQYLKRQTNQ
jgi:cytoplasmic iron level regulating protein YaaA (DUF328/UPF0246 family)